MTTERKTLRNTWKVPPGGWTYLEKATGYEVKADSFSELMHRVRLHKEANGLDLPDDWQRIVEAEICEMPKMADHVQ